MKKTSYSFVGGEVSPEFWGNVGDSKYQSGLAVCENMVVKPHGPVENRAGTKFVGICQTPSTKNRLIPFVFNQNQAYVLEFGNQTLRFIVKGALVQSGGAVLVKETPYLAQDVFGIKYVQSYDVMTLVHPSYPPYELRRVSAGAANDALISAQANAAVASNALAAARATAQAESVNNPPNAAVLAAQAAYDSAVQETTLAIALFDAALALYNANPNLATANNLASKQFLQDTAISNERAANLALIAAREQNVSPATLAALLAAQTASDNANAAVVAAQNAVAAANGATGGFVLSPIVFTPSVGPPTAGAAPVAQVTEAPPETVVPPTYPNNNPTPPDTYNDSNDNIGANDTSDQSESGIGSGGAGYSP